MMMDSVQESFLKFSVIVCEYHLLSQWYFVLQSDAILHTMDYHLWHANKGCFREHKVKGGGDDGWEKSKYYRVNFLETAVWYEHKSGELISRHGAMHSAVCAV